MWWPAPKRRLRAGTTNGANAQGDPDMLLTIAFLMFAVLIAGWLVAPDKGREEYSGAPASSSTTMPADVAASKA